MAKCRQRGWNSGDEVEKKTVKKEGTVMQAEVRMDKTESME